MLTPWRLRPDLEELKMKLKDETEQSEKKIKPMLVKISYLRKILNRIKEDLIPEWPIVFTKVLGLNEGFHEIQPKKELKKNQSSVWTILIQTSRTKNLTKTKWVQRKRNLKMKRWRHSKGNLKELIESILSILRSRPPISNTSNHGLSSLLRKLK